MMKKHTILLVAIEGFQSLDLFGPLEVFAAAKDIAGCPYVWKIGAFEDAPVTTESGTRILPDAILSTDLDVDTLVLCGGCGPRQINLSKAEREILGTLAEKSKRVVGICTGSFLIAQLGLAESLNVGTHWNHARELQQMHENISVDADALYVRDGKVWTSAGVTAGIDLCLALVDEDYGSSVSISVARYLVVYMRRGGGKTSFRLCSRLNHQTQVSWRQC